MIYDAIDYAERVKELTGLPFKGLLDAAKKLPPTLTRQRVGWRLRALKKVGGGVS